VSLLVTAPQSRIDRAADAPRRRILLAGLVTIGCLGLLVYLFAPLIARNRHARQERDRAARVLSHLGEGVFLVDEEGVVTLWNPGAEAITGIEAAAVRERHARDVIPGWEQLRSQIPVGGERLRPATIPLE